MLRLRLSYPHQPERPLIEVDGDAAECAQFIAALENMRTAAPAPGVKNVSAKEESGQSRTYGGKPNRRHMVLETLRDLRQKGQPQPNLEVICSRFHHLYPAVETDNLDQVVRDLANKTEWVNRCDRGTFELSDQGTC